MTRLGVCFLSFLLFSGTPVRAWNRVGNLLSYCEAEMRDWSKGGPISEYASNCTSYFEGINDTLAGLKWPIAKNACMQGRLLNLDSLDNVKIFVDYMKKHPEIDADEVAYRVVVKAIEETCP